MCSLLSRSIFFLIFLTSLSEAAITEWVFVKGQGGVLEADNQAPNPTIWDVEIYVATSSAGDATGATISGGGINGSLAFEWDDGEWIFEKDYQSEAAMDAEFPNNSSYTITLTGGTLGEVTQTVNVGAKAYPDVPYFTGTVFSSLQAFDPAAAFDFTFGTPSSTPDLTIIEIDDSFDVEVAGFQGTIGMGANTLSSGQVYEGYADHVNTVSASGAGGFGVDGLVAHTAYSRFNVDTASANSIIGAWSFGDATTDGSGIVMFMKDQRYFHIEDVEAGDPEPDGYEMGTYAWNEQTGVFTTVQTLDRNGEVGLSNLGDSTTVSVSGDTLTLSIIGEEDSVLTRVKSDSNPLVGGWQFGESSPLDSRALVFLPNGIYFEAQNLGQLKGMEKGTYLWDPVTGEFEVELLVDTETELAFSKELEEFELRVQGDEMLIYDQYTEWRLYLVDPTTEGIPIPAVTHWSFLKGREHFQNQNNTAPSAAAWSINVSVGTKMNDDASNIEMRITGRPEVYPLVHNSARGWEFEKDYHSEVAMNTEFPEGAEITLELSGGNLGTMSQTFTLMMDRYPNTPYLQGTRFTDAQSFDSFSDFHLNWSSPGSFTAASGQTVLEVFRFYDDESVFRQSQIGAATQGTVPAGTVLPGHTFYGYLEYTHARSIDGAGGFEVDGTESRNAAVDFNLGTLESPLAGAWSFGDSSGDDSGVLVFLNNGTFFHIEDVAQGDPDPDGFERGEYEWDRDSGAFEFEVIRDTNGTVGLSDSGDVQTIVVSGNSLTFTDDGVAEVLPKVTSANDPLVGGWQYGDGGDEYGDVYVFFENGYYFGLAYDEPLGLPLVSGIERGTYTYEEVDLIPVLTVNAVLDTNGEDGLSHPDEEWTSDLRNDIFSFFDNRGGEFLKDAEQADISNRIRVSDPNFDAALREASGKMSGHLLNIDVQRILKMDASNRGILEAYEILNAYNLRDLDLSDNAIVDVWPIGDLLELRFLDLSSNQIEDISYLSNLTKLVELDLSDNNLSDPGLAADSSSDIIQVLSVSEPLASTGTLSALDGIDTLEVLDIAGNGIRDLTVLATLPALKEVDLSGNQIEDLTPLENLASLEKISLFDNPIDLSDNSSQKNLLDAIVANTGASTVLEAPDPFASLLTWEWDEASERYRILWTENGTLQSSSDLENWTNEDSASSPHPVDLSGSPLYWRLDF